MDVGAGHVRMTGGGLPPHAAPGRAPLRSYSIASNVNGINMRVPAIIFSFSDLNWAVDPMVRQALAPTARGRPALIPLPARQIEWRQCRTDMLDQNTGKCALRELGAGSVLPLCLPRVAVRSLPPGSGFAWKVGPGFPGGGGALGNSSTGELTSRQLRNIFF